MKMITRILKAEGAEKTRIFNELTWEEGNAIIEEFLFKVPIKEWGYSTAQLSEIVAEALGWIAGIRIDKKFMMGLRSLNDEKMTTSFTHGLDEIIFFRAKRGRRKK